MYLIIGCDNEIITTETGEREWNSADAAETYSATLGDFNAPRRIVEASDWYATE